MSLQHRGPQECDIATGAAARISNASAGSSRSKTDLMRRAREIGIDGRSTMSKGELVSALRNH